MGSALTEREQKTAPKDGQPVVNDVVIKVATVNGSGSQSANLILLRAIFKMGIPVSSKNRFPSNIEGLPTWFVVRANKDGWLGASEKVDVFVAMNSKSFKEDMEYLPKDTLVILNERFKHDVTRDDLELYPVPFSKLAKECCDDTRLRKKIVNVIYVGVLAWLLDMEIAEVDGAIEQQFGGKARAVALNRDAARAGYDWASKNFDKFSKFRLERANGTEGKIIIEGNQAIALGLLFGGVSLLAWYPITPSSGVCESLMRYLHMYRRDPETGRATYAVVQAEDEIASIGMVLGGGWTGARACTATSGPGLSLMAEMAGLSYFAEVPAVIVDVQRMGPSTGLPTRTAQSDMLKAYNLSHGDCKHVLLIPGNVRECYEFAVEALDLAEQLQTLIILMSDLDIGMNKWLAEPFEPPAKPMNRGKVLTAEDLERDGGFHRYGDVDGDGIPYRTLPGTNHPKAAYFTRGTGHTTEAEYSEKAVTWQANMDRLKRKFDTARTMVPRPVLDEVDGAKIGLIAYGSTEQVMDEARHMLGTEHGISSSYLRLRALPVNGDVERFISKFDRVYVIEQNRDAQVASILKDEYPVMAARIRNVLHYNGRSLDAVTLVKNICEQEAGQS